MARTDRVEVLCAACLEGPRWRPGLTPWSPVRLIAIAASRNGKVEMAARLEESSRFGRGILWELSARFTTEQEAVAKIRSIAERPDDSFGDGRTYGDAANDQALRSLFSGLELKSLIDTTQGDADLSSNRVTIGAGRFLASAVESGNDLTDRIMKGVERYFSAAPFIFGYWAPYKRLVKLLESRPETVELLGVAFARLDGDMERVPNAQATDDLRPYLSTPVAEVASAETIAYMVRRGRRLIRKLGRSSHSDYVRCARSFLRAVDRQGAQKNIALRWILAEILYGRGATDEHHGHGSLTLPAVPARYNRRWDRFPEAWNARLGDVRHIWIRSTKNPDIQAWAFNVLRSQRQAVPALPRAGLRLALLGPANKVRQQACEQVASKSARFLKLDLATAQAFLEFSSTTQFAAVYPTLESNAAVQLVQDAVLAYINEHGFPEVRRGATPVLKGSRAQKLLCYSLRFMRPRLTSADTFQLARYVGQTTKFQPVAQWKETFTALPLKTLVELRLQLVGLPIGVARAIDKACRDAAAKGAGDENLAIALTLSPSRELRVLGWQLLAGAGHATISNVWNHLVAQCGSDAGLQRLLECARQTTRIERLQGCPGAPELLSRIVLTVVAADSKIAERLLHRLAATGDTSRTLQTLDRLLSAYPGQAWINGPALLRKIISADPAVTKLIWSASGNDEMRHLAQSHLASTYLAAVLTEVVDSDDLLRITSGQAELLVQALRIAPHRFLRDRWFAVSTGTCPHPAVHQHSLAFLESRGQVPDVFLPLIESGLPAAIATSERYLNSIKNRETLTKSIIAVCDSGASQARTLGLRMLQQRADDCDQSAVLTALAEHTAPEVTAAVALHALSESVIRRDALARFDDRVLRTRRSGRRAKDLVKARLTPPTIENTIAITAGQMPEEQRIKALTDMARGSSRRDREWAFQQLARLALDGQTIPHLQVSTTS